MMKAKASNDARKEEKNDDGTITIKCISPKKGRRGGGRRQFPQTPKTDSKQMERQLKQKLKK